MCFFPPADADFTDASFLTDKRIAESDRLTVGQIKATWNDKHGNMKGIRLPADIASELEEDGADDATEKTPANEHDLAA